MKFTVILSWPINDDQCEYKTYRNVASVKELLEQEGITADGREMDISVFDWDDDVPDLNGVEPETDDDIDIAGTHILQCTIATYFELVR